MTTPGDSPDGAFEPLADGASARADTSTEGSNVCRAASLAALLRGSTAATSALTAEMSAVGFSSLVLRGQARAWVGQDLLGRLGRRAFDGDLDQTRMSRWAELNENDDPRAAVEFLLAMLGSTFERESAAAAAALWRGLDLGTQSSIPSFIARRRIYDRLIFDPSFVDISEFWWLQATGIGEPDFSNLEPVVAPAWDSNRWANAYRQLQGRLGEDPYVDPILIAGAVRARLAQALQSADPISQSLAVAALLPLGDSDSRLPTTAFASPAMTPAAARTVSTIIHGTAAWAGDWWRPQIGDFHRFIHNTYRPNLYDRGAHFSWSGALRARHRARAAEDFRGWAHEVTPIGIQSLFGHSYGGEIAARASNLGVPIQQLVLLSTPVTGHVEAAATTGATIVDIRLPLDPVLLLALTPQRIRPRENVTAVHTSWRLDHGATHQESVWVSDDIAERGQIMPEQGLVSR